MPLVHGYLRVSDDLQVGRKTISNGQIVSDDSLSTQQARIELWWSENRHRFPDHQFHGFYSDPAQSARKIPLSQRPQGAHLVASLQPGDIVIAADQSRLFRSDEDYYRTRELFRQLDVRLVLLTNPDIDIRTATGKMVGSIMAAVHALEAEQLSERLRVAYHSRESRGCVCGPYIPLGWKKVYDIDQQTGRVLRYFAECERERQMLQCVAYIQTVETWTQDRYRLHRKDYGKAFRRGTRGEKRFLMWEEFKIAAFVIEQNYPMQQLVHPRRGYRYDRVSAEAVHVRRRSARVVRPPSPPAVSVHAEDLLQAPAGTSVWKLRRQLNQALAQVAALESQLQQPSD